MVVFLLTMVRYWLLVCCWFMDRCWLDDCRGTRILSISSAQLPHDCCRIVLKKSFLKALENWIGMGLAALPSCPHTVPKEVSNESWFNLLVNKNWGPDDRRWSQSWSVALIVTCNAFKHFNELVTSLLVALLITVIFGTKFNISCKNVTCFELEIIGLRIRS